VVEGVVAPKVVVDGVVPNGLDCVAEPNMPPVVAEGAPNGLCVGPPNTEDEAGCCVVAPKGEGEAVDPKPNPVVDGVVPPKVLVPVVG
jgi:hypothetical protein